MPTGNLYDEIKNKIIESGLSVADLIGIIKDHGFESHHIQYDEITGDLHIEITKKLTFNLKELTNASE